MLFRRKIPRACEYCAHCAKLDNNQLVCAKKGLLQEDRSCRRFQYDPLKRVPSKPKAIDFSQYDQQDFSL